MSEKENILDLSEKNRLTADITLLMLKGGGYALVFCLAVWAVIAVIALIGRALPEESRDTPDPINRSSLELMVQQDDYA
ncbi:RC-LH1 core complex protein PufX [Yoonia sediminilitoris]|uniref:Intrinsic membrane protein PufX n=1 Tax=Yoonia sediminilitoris TaxID=1286148 RepID=A0A2T6K8J6_9RHOB|nr:RC-LH1 core complex protein PufX [Yoonia sediminilitoris]PUB11056.1 intrinsic membrane protein PufX [Yoonia sediminilitoris]RCW90975.1 intrinsic membrane protein PufX [Yoonia sediminilitoris]